MSMTTRLARRCRVTKGDGFKLADVDPGDTGGVGFGKREGYQVLEGDLVPRLAELQEKLYAHDRWALLLIFQGMDAAGKDGAIKHVMSGINPQGCQVSSFKVPSAEELDHDFMWRTSRMLPERGRIGIFNRSYYEELLVVRVHPEILAGQKVPAKLVGKGIWKERFADICAFERFLAHNGTVVCKFFLHISREEQRQRFLARLDDPSKNWKFSMADVAERHHWDAYQAAYEDVVRSTAARHAPWYVVPSDHKWFARLVVASVVIETLAGLGLAFPTVDDAKLQDLQAAREALAKEE